MIEVRNLTKEFKSPKKYPGFIGAVKSFFTAKYDIKRAVDNVSFDIAEGEMVGYIGVNGAGKSTTIKMLSGIMVPTSGECTVDGIVPYKRRKENAKNIGVVFGQRTQLWWDLPVSESFGILKEIYDIPKKRYEENLTYFKEVLSLEDFFLTPVRNLSLGQKMRADLAASFLHDPKVVYLDEPTIGLDILVKDRIRKSIRELNSLHKTTVILTTHDLNDIEEICKRVIIIDQGKKLYDSSIDDLKKTYGRKKEVRFVLGENVRVTANLALEKAMKAPKGSIDIAYPEGEIVVKFDYDKIDTSAIISTVLKKTEVRDIMIEDVQMEDIVKQIYAGDIRLR
ncbi:MAG: sugar ABC transporter ATP-binding protein [Spirochaetes bacterium GWF1_51_8]|nr:MAG: sugar ABC transporter ATP-binding protein [Spirochaetes bacterium GWF1_51_8]